MVGGARSQLVDDLRRREQEEPVLDDRIGDERSDLGSLDDRKLRCDQRPRFAVEGDLLDDVRRDPRGQRQVTPIPRGRRYRARDSDSPTIACLVAV